MLKENLLIIIQYEKFKRNKAVLTLLQNLDTKNHEITQLEMLCCITRFHKIISIRFMPFFFKQVIQRYFQHHFFYHVLKFDCRYIFSIRFS